VAATAAAEWGILGAMIGTRRGDRPLDEDALLARARAGDRDAFGTLVERHLPHVWRVAFRIVRDEADAEDVAQETFLAAWRALATFRGEALFSTWLHRIAVARALNHLDRAAEKTRRASAPLVRGDGAEIDVGPEWGAEAEARSPLAALEAEELRRRLLDCFRALPGPWRVVLALRDAEELPYEEIAARADLALGTVRSRLARARLRLKECVERGAAGTAGQ